MSVSDALVTTVVQTLASDPQAREQLWTSLRAAGVPLPYAPTAPVMAPSVAAPPVVAPYGLGTFGGLTSSPGISHGFLPSDEKATQAVNYALMAHALPIHHQAMQAQNAVEQARWRVDQETAQLSRARAEVERARAEVAFEEAGGKTALKVVGAVVVTGTVVGGFCYLLGRLAATRERPPSPPRRWPPPPRRCG